MDGSVNGGVAAQQLAEGVALLADRAGAGLSATLIRQSLRRARSAAARVCFVGGTNTGKSQLVNTVVGAALLPVSVRPGADPPALVRSAGAAAGGSAGASAGDVSADVSADLSAGGYRVVAVPASAGDGWLAGAGLELVETRGWDTWVADAASPAPAPGRGVAPRGIPAALPGRGVVPGTSLPGAGVAPSALSADGDAPDASGTSDGSNDVLVALRPAQDGGSARLVADCDALVVVIQAERALTSTEQAAVRALAAEPHCPPLLVVVTALDRVGEESAGDGSEAAEVMHRVRRRIRTLAPEALVLPGPGVPADADRLAQVRDALTALTGARLRLSLRGERRLRLLAATCALVADAARRAVAEAVPGDPLRARATEVWHAAREGAVYEWVGLAAALDHRRADLLARVAAEAGRRRAACIAALAAELAQAPEAPAFVRLRVRPQTDVALQELQAWIAEEITAAFAADTEWLREALTRGRPGTDLFAGLAPVGAAATAIPVAAPSPAVSDGGWDASWLPDVLGPAVEGVLAPLAPEVIARALGAAAGALLGDAVERGQAQRLDRTADALEHTVAAAFTGHLARVEERLDQLHAQLLGRARERDEQWWRLNTAALTAHPDSATHWRTLLAEAVSLGESVAARLAAREEA
ncbi:hypothetical protein [Streptomyces sp. NBC_01198]|uniref:hypothetical protein n=1 Tax=Streptomyces sp. NBC_01198 TaxID=2903769 RepID=UPI002E0E580C|nr:hypothetical protein OG702_18710 [Streptomyces sp. NBC_01198]